MWFARILLPVVMAVLFTTGAQAGEQVYSDWLGRAIKGYDSVAYHTVGKPVQGNSDFELEWNGATWRFASTQNRDLFKADPEKYAPQYGGYCAYGVSQGYKVKIEPDLWAIIEGKLYLNYSQSVQETWNKDRPGYIAKAEATWPDIKDN